MGTSGHGDGEGSAQAAALDRARAHVAELVAGVRSWDALEQEHLAEAAAWVAGGAPLWRLRPPDVPPVHLVSYFVVVDEARGELLLVGHRKAGLWLPSGGHVEPLEHPWRTVVRECEEELGIAAVPVAACGERPLFLTVTTTQGAVGQHTDVSLWFVLRAERESVVWFDPGEFTGVRWLGLDAVLAEPIARMDPHMHRFTRKLRAELGL